MISKAAYDKGARTMFKRVIVIVLDSAGIGALPDAAEYGDVGVNTIANIARSQDGLFLPTMETMGLGSIEQIAGVHKLNQPMGSFGKMAEISKGKDTTTGHWEMTGCPIFKKLPLYPDGFPPEVINSFIQYTGHHILGNKAESGTAIIAELGPKHMATGYPIVYTSGDSVFQIAAHEDVIPLTELYEICRIAREKVCVGEHAVGRIIARPFIGTPGNFKRTANRHDYSLPPYTPTILDIMKEAGYAVTGVGKIGDIFAQRGLTQSLTTKSNDHGMQTLIKLVRQSQEEGLIMVNLVEFDSGYGHRNDARGYGKALERFDGQLAMLLDELNDTDLLIITADHGCDPTISGTDHTREYVPLLSYFKGCSAHDLGIRLTFADLAATISENFKVKALPYGKSFLREILR